MDGGVIGTIFGSILGFLASILPEVFAMISSWLNHKRDIEKNAQKIEAGKTGKLGEGETIKLDDSSGAPVLIPSPVTKLDAEDIPEESSFWIKVMAVLRASVRPVITYAFFGIFAFIKLMAMYHALMIDKTPVTQLMPILWDDGTQSLFAAVLAFWFGSRALAKTRTNNTNQTPNVPSK